MALFRSVRPRAVALALVAACAQPLTSTDATGDSGETGDTGVVDEGPAFQRVQITLKTWHLLNAGLNVELPGDLELQIGWILAYPNRPNPDDRAEIATDVDLLQKGDIKGDETIWVMNEVLATFDHYCDDPDPQIVLTLLEVDEGFDDTADKTRAGLAAAITGLGVFYPVAGVVLGIGSILEGVLAKNDDLGQGDFRLTQGSNRLSLSGRETRSVVTVDMDVLSGRCP